MEIKYDVHLATGSGILFYRQVISDRDPLLFIDGYSKGTYDPKKGIQHGAITINLGNGALHCNDASYSIRRLPPLINDFEGIVIGKEHIYDHDTSLQMAAFLAKLADREGGHPAVIGYGADFDGNVSYPNQCRTLPTRCRIWSNPKQDRVYGPVNHSSFKRDPYRR